MLKKIVRPNSSVDSFVRYFLQVSYLRFYFFFKLPVEGGGTDVSHFVSPPSLVTFSFLNRQWGEGTVGLNNASPKLGLLVRISY